MKNESILNELYNPNDKLGVEIFGLENWNRAKGAACGVTNSLISRSFRPSSTVVNTQYTPLFNALFRPDRAKFCELLGASAPIDYLPWSWAESIADIGHGITEGLNQFSFFKPWISGGRSINSGIAKALNAMGFTSRKDSDDDAPTVKTYAIGAGTILLIGGGIWALWYFSRPKRHHNRRRHRG